MTTNNHNGSTLKECLSFSGEETMFVLMRIYQIPFYSNPGIVLDPELVSECKADIHKFCKELEDKYMRPGKEKPDDGLVFECLVDALQDKMVGCNWYLIDK